MSSEQPNALIKRGLHDGLNLHSDREVQFCSISYRTMSSENGITSSMNTPGYPYGNACIESFLTCFKKEPVYRSNFKDIEDVRETFSRYT